MISVDQFFCDGEGHVARIDQRTLYGDLITLYRQFYDSFEISYDCSI